MKSHINNSLSPLRKAALFALFSISAAVAPTGANAYSLVTYATEYEHYSVSEGYQGDVELLFRQKEQAKSSAKVKQRHRFHFDDEEALVVDVGTSIYSDTDGDGFFTRFSLSFDVDTHYGEEEIYARISIRSDETDYELFHTTSTFSVYDDFDSDTFRIESKLVNNYPAGYYDLKLDILDARSDELLDSVDAASHPTLFSLPLESTLLDDGGRQQIVHEHVGAVLLMPLALLGFVAFRRYY